MEKVILDGNRLRDREALHALLAEKLHFPSWYGANLDALFDCLTDLQEETEIEIINADALEAALGSAYLESFRRVLERAAHFHDCAEDGSRQPRIRVTAQDKRSGKSGANSSEFCI